ncbi:MAG: M48 family metalloprotease [Deltaproteobacteria bacterium]|nr:M48 family metalloprotease [Deltaproteobacteria bacterium]
MARLLNDNELRAIIAHEMAHGDKVHGIKNLTKILKSLGLHASELMAEEAVWFLTGEVGPTLKKVTAEGNLTAIIEGNANQTPELEIEADRGGTEILLKGGFNSGHLISALMKLHGEVPSSASEEKDALSKHPELSVRVSAIKEAAGISE